MSSESPCIRGPKVARIDGREYISVRHFHFTDETVRVIRVTLWHEEGWQCHSHSGTLYPVSLAELRGWGESSGLQIDSVWESYNCEPFNENQSTDLLILATKKDEL